LDIQPLEGNWLEEGEDLVVINGREVGFAFNTRAVMLAADICPNRDINKIDMMIQGKVGNIIENQTRFILAMNKAYVLSSEHRGENQKPLTEDELLDMSPEEFMDVFTAAYTTRIKDGKTNIETKPTKKQNARQPKES
jgi:hypothetical protein